MGTVTGTEYFIKKFCTVSSVHCTVYIVLFIYTLYFYKSTVPNKYCTEFLKPSTKSRNSYFISVFHLMIQYS